MNINNLFPSKYLKSGDLGDEDMVLTIANVTTENVGTGEKQEVKPVLYFNEIEKGMILNKTNASTISTLYGPETDGWVGKRIALFATEVDFAGKQTLALRVRMRQPQGKAKAPVINDDPVTQFWTYVNTVGMGKEKANKALAEAGGDFVEALELLQEQES